MPNSYAAHPDEPMSKFVNALTFVDSEVPLPRIVAWLLIVDGFVPSQRRITSDSRPWPGVPCRIVAAGPRRLGAWRSPLFRPLPSSSRSPRTHCWSPTSWRWSRRHRVSVTASPSLVHEGHGGPGDRQLRSKPKVQALRERRTPRRSELVP